MHYTWDTGNEAVLAIDSGDTVVLWTRDVSDNQIQPGSDANALVTLDVARFYPLTGPIAVNGAEPGDTLKIDILDVHTQGWGWTEFAPGRGPAAQRVPRPLSADASTCPTAMSPYLRDDIAIPLEPYFGTMGVCPAGATAQDVMPPGTFGGNMDIRQLVRGSTLFLPVQVEQALFSCGDAHAAQGDGEVCVTGIESPMFASLRFTLQKGSPLPGPQFRTPAPLTPRVDSAPFYATTGVSGDLYAASQDAVRAMIDYLVTPTTSAGRTPSCCAVSPSTSRSPRSSTRASTSSARCSRRRSSRPRSSPISALTTRRACAKRDGHRWLSPR